jgi:hypothetical protein
MERSYGRAGASGGSRCEQKIPLGPTITFAAIVTCWCTSTRPRSENEVMEPQRSDRCGRKIPDLSGQICQRQCALA